MKFFNLFSILIFLLLPLFCLAEEESPGYLWSELDLHTQNTTDDLSQLKKRRVIRALVVHSKTGFFINNGKIKGLDAEYLKQYEKLLNNSIKKEAEKFISFTSRLVLNSLSPP